jgi:glycosyltransferase involved in cell wall biosynthesis
MKTLGVSMIVKNESQIIETCLNSVKDADEIVIIDTGSKDNTIELCKKYTDKVYSDKWRDDFSYSRNVSLSHCTADYVLIIDADETLEVPISQIKRMINEPFFNAYSGMLFVIETKPETFESPRLLKNCPEIKYINAIHNLPAWNGSNSDLQSKLYRTSFKIKSGYSPAHNLDPDRTLRILKKDLFWHPKNIRNRYYLGKEYLNKKKIRKAVRQFEMYRKAAFFDVGKWSNELADTLYLLALCYADDKTYKNGWFKSVQYATESFNVLPTSSETAKLLKTLFKEAPNTEDTRRRCFLATRFWEIIEKNSQNTGVMMKRNN